MSRRLQSLARLAALIGAVACSRASPSFVHTYDAYDGGAPYPNVRPKLALPSGDFALVPSSGADRLALVDLTAGATTFASPVGRDPVRLDGPHQIVADLRARVGYLVMAYPGAVAASGTHSHGNSALPGWVQAISLEDFRAIGEVRLDPNPGELALSDDGRRLVVTHFDLAAASTPGASLEARRATLAIVDPAAMLPSDTPEPDKLLTCVAPHGVALSRPDGKTAYVACYGEDALAVVDVADVHAPVVRVPLGPAATTSGPPAYGPYGVSLSPDGQRVAIGTMDSKEVRFFGVSAGAMEALVIATPGAAYVATWSLDGKDLFVPTQGQDALNVYDANTGAPLRARVFDAATCVAPLEVTLGSDGATLHVVCEGGAGQGGALVTLDRSTLATRARVEVGPFPGRPFVGRGP